MTIHYSKIQLFFWFIYGAIVNFASVYLLANGASNTACGIVSAVACILSIFIQPWIATYADKEKSLSVKALILIISGALLVCTAALAVLKGRGRLWKRLIRGASILDMQELLPLVNSLATETMNAGKQLNYSAARGFGSIGYAVMSFSLGKIVAELGSFSQPVVSIVTVIAFLILTVTFPFEKRVAEPAGLGKESGVEAPAGGSSVMAFLRRYRLFSIGLIGCSLIYASHVYINSFVFQIAVAKGGTSEHMGVAMGLAGLLEMLPMFLFAVLLKKKGAGFWMCFSGVFFTLKCLGTMLAPSIPAFYAVQLFQPFGWGLMTVASVYYVNSIMEDKDRIKGQAYMTMTLSIGTIIGSLSGGTYFSIANY